MNRLVWVRTAPPDMPGSMVAYGELVRQAVAPLADGWEMAACDLFDPRGGANMWRHHLWRLRHAPRVLAELDADLVHWLDGSMAAFIPRALRGYSVVTVHDLIPLLQLRKELPGQPSWPAARLIRRGIRVLGECAGLCTISRATKTDLAKWAGLAHGVAAIPMPLRTLPLPRPVVGLDLPERFLFHLGHNAAYKNRLGVLAAFSRLSDFTDLHLVLAGPPPTRELRQLAAQSKRVHFIGPVDDARLSVLYHRAALFLFPSLYEGFGMPVLEAMAAGCPVVCSTAAALVEVAAEAALFAPADDPDALAEQCRSLLNDESLRNRMAARGRLRATAFDVATMGRSLMEWYETALNKMSTKEAHD